MEPRIWQKCYFSDWLKRCKTMDEWDELLRNVPSYEWNIHRKLGEAAGLAHRYIIPARGSGKSMFYWDSFDEPEEIFKKYRTCKKPRGDNVAIKDGDIEQWWLEQRNRERVDALYDMIVDFDRRADTRLYLTTFNPYLQPEGYWYDPSWEVRPDGSIRLREISLMPGYLYPLDKEVL